MTRINYLLILILLFTEVRAQSTFPQFTAAQNCGIMGINGQSSTTAIKIDASGNRYITGTFRGTVAFGQFMLTTAGVEDVFIAKLDAVGNYVWAVRAGGNYIDSGNDLALDSAGNVYVTGSFASQQADFGGTTFSQFNINFSKTFVAKLSSTGSWLWAVQADGGYYSFNDSAAALTLDTADNIYIAGQFDSKTLTLGTHTVSNSDPSLRYDQHGQPDLYVAKLSPSGTWLWAVGGGGKDNEAAVGIALDAAQNVYVAGYFDSATATFGSTTLPRSGYSNVVVAKLSTAGTWQWVVPGGSANYTYPEGLAVADNGTVYLAGQFFGTTTFGLTNLTSAGRYDTFVAKLNPSGTWAWATRSGGTLNEYGAAIALDKAGSAYVTGAFQSPVIDAGTLTLGNTTSDYDIFAARLDAQGTWQWGVTAGGDEGNYGQAITLDNQGGLYLAGYSTGTLARFGPFALPGNPAVNKGRLGYIARLSNAVLSSQLAHTSQRFTIYPNPSQGTISLEGLVPGQQINLYRLTGELVHTVIAIATTTSLTLPTSVASGMYLVRNGYNICKLQIQ